MAFPFFIPKYEHLFYKLPPALKQMRASGRFAWIFYYAAVYFTAVTLYHLFKNVTFKRAWLLVLLIVGWFIESSIINTNSRKDLHKYSERFDLNVETKDLVRLINDYGKQTRDFNGILFLPFILNGSEKIQFENSHFATGMLASLATGIPMISGAMSRTSLSQTLQIASLMSDSFLPKPFLNCFGTNKPLLAVTRQDKDLSEHEQKILARSNFIGESGWFKLYELPLSAFTYSNNQLQKLLREAAASPAQHTAVLYRSYDEMQSRSTFFGKGALEGSANPTSIFYGSLPNANDGDRFEFSIWTLAENTTTSMPAIYLSVVDEAENKTIESHELLAKHSGNIAENWVQVKGEFTLARKDYTVSIVGYADRGVYDEMLIRRTDCNFFVADGTGKKFKHLYNNYPVY